METTRAILGQKEEFYFPNIWFSKYKLVLNRLADQSSQSAKLYSWNLH